MTDRSHEIPQDLRNFVRVVSACTLGLWAFAAGLLIGVFLFSSSKVLWPRLPPLALARWSRIATSPSAGWRPFRSLRVNPKVGSSILSTGTSRRRQMPR
jgi:hypothetical protein